MKQIEAHKHYWLGENKQCHPEHEIIIRLADPRVFIKYRVDLAMFADYEEFIEHIAEVQWIDGKPDKFTQEKILTEAWNFLCIEERILEEDIERMEDEEDDEYYDDEDTDDELMY